ncbi:membrane protein [Neisseria gonorrhoeae]|nr:membrane protein [Neisseria gonorrhoeae]KDN00206.1 membrane protein [Neisseria gonorrhoeae]KDN02568.1 membrane protein [Neisseria gonorrhoeae]
MTPSLLLSGLTFRLFLALIAVFLLWGVYLWAVSV